MDESPFSIPSCSGTDRSFRAATNARQCRQLHGPGYKPHPLKTVNVKAFFVTAAAIAAAGTFFLTVIPEAKANSYNFFPSQQRTYNNDPLGYNQWQDGRQQRQIRQQLNRIEDNTNRYSFY